MENKEEKTLTEEQSKNIPREIQEEQKEENSYNPLKEIVEEEVKIIPSNNSEWKPKKPKKQSTPAMRKRAEKMRTAKAIKKKEKMKKSQQNGILWITLKYSSLVIAGILLAFTTRRMIIPKIQTTPIMKKSTTIKKNVKKEVVVEDLTPLRVW